MTFNPSNAREESPRGHDTKTLTRDQEIARANMVRRGARRATCWAVLVIAVTPVVAACGTSTPAAVTPAPAAVVETVAPVVASLYAMNEREAMAVCEAVFTGRDRADCISAIGDSFK